MVKESRKRGYMTEEEVEEHLKDYKSGPDRIRYLDRALKHEKILSKETRRNVYDVALTEYKKAGMLDKVAEIYEKKEENPGSSGRGIWMAEAARTWEKAGNRKRAQEAYAKLALAYEEEDLIPAHEAWRKAGGEEKRAETYEKAGMFDKAAWVWEKLGQHEKAQRVREKNKQNKGDLSSRLSSVIAIGGILGGLFFLSSNITGNAIGSQAVSNSIGAFLLIVGLVAGFFWLKSSKR